MKLGALIREIYDVAQPVYVEATLGYGKATILLQCSKSDLVKHLRTVYPSTKTETDLTLVNHGAIRILMAEAIKIEAAPVAEDPVFEDVSSETLEAEAAAEVADVEAAVKEAARRRKKGLADAQAFVEANIVYGAKFDYETRQFVAA